MHGHHSYARHYSGRRTNGFTAGPVSKHTHRVVGGFFYAIGTLWFARDFIWRPFVERPLGAEAIGLALLYVAVLIFVLYLVRTSRRLAVAKRRTPPAPSFPYAMGNPLDPKD